MKKNRDLIFWIMCVAAMILLVADTALLLVSLGR